MRRTIGTRRSLALALAAALGMGTLASDARAQNNPVMLGDTAASFAILGGAGVTNVPISTITGNVGGSPNGALTGFIGGPNDPQVDGTLHRADAVAALAKAEFLAARGDILGRTPDQSAMAVELGGQTLIPGVYAWTGAAAISSGQTLTLDGQGDLGAQWLFQIPTTLTVGSDAAVVFVNASPTAGNNVYWAVGSASIGTSASFAGTILAADSITMGANAVITCGRAVTDVESVTLIMNTITICVAANGDDDDVDDIPMDELGGEGVTGGQQTAFNASRLFGSAMLAQTVFPYLAVGAPGMGPQPARPAYPEKYTPLKVGPSDESAMMGGDYYYQPRRWRVWAAGLGGSSSLDGDRGSGSLDTNIGGVAGGIDYRFNPTALIGIAGGYTDSEFSVDQLKTKGTLKGAHVGVYGVKSFGQIYLAGTAEYAHFDNETDRFIEFVVDERARGSFNSDSFGGRLEAGWRRPFGRHYVTPFVGVDAYELDVDGFTENSQRVDGGRSILGLTYRGDSVTSVTSSVGIQFDTQFVLANDRVLTPFVRVAWVHEYDPERVTRSFLTGAPAASFLVDGASAAEDVARVHAGLKLDLSERIALFGFFEGDFSDRSDSYAGVGGGDVAFLGSGQGQNYAGRVGMRVGW